MPVLKILKPVRRYFIFSKTFSLASGVNDKKSMMPGRHSFWEDAV